MPRLSTRALLLSWVTCAMAMVNAVRAGVDYRNDTGQVQTIRVNYDFSTTVTVASRKYAEVTRTQAYFESDGRLNVYFITEIADNASTAYSYSLVSTKTVDYVVQPDSSIAISDTEQTNYTSGSSTSTPQDEWYFHFWDPMDVGTVFDIYASRISHEETTTGVARRTSISFFVVKPAASTGSRRDVVADRTTTSRTEKVEPRPASSASAK